MSKERPKILFAGGGTGGHLFPALAIAGEMKKLNPDMEAMFVGTRGKIEADIVPRHGYPFHTIWISGLQRGAHPQNLLLPLKIAVSLLQSFFLIRGFAPDAVVGTGGYICWPVLYAATVLGIPTIIHESNSYPGLATRLLAHRVTKVFTAFQATNRWLKRTDNVELVGTPVRESLSGVSREEAIRFFGLDPGKKTALIFGGSLGAASINNAVEQMLDDLAGSGVQLVWQTGRSAYSMIKQSTRKKNIGWVGPFIDRMEFAYAAADVVVCRSGATTVAEITALGKPAILIPYPHAAADHQTENAKTLADAGAALVIADREASAKLPDTLLGLLNDTRRRSRMIEAGRKLGKPEAGKVIAKKISEMIG